MGGVEQLPSVVSNTRLAGGWCRTVVKCLNEKTHRETSSCQPRPDSESAAAKMDESEQWATAVRHITFKVNAASQCFCIHLHGSFCVPEGDESGIDLLAFCLPFGRVICCRMMHTCAMVCC